MIDRCRGSVPLGKAGVGSEVARSANTIGKTVILLAVVILSGCTSRSVPLAAYTQSGQLYLQAKPHTRLYVEIDRMEGVSLPEGFVDELKAFLRKCCQKADGIEVILDPPIPAAEFEDVPLSAASVLCIDGPAVDSDPQPAYLHVFVYDGKTMFKGAVRSPHVVGSCLSGIYWNVDYARSWPGQTVTHMLRHELGHVLGLCRNATHGDGVHCDKHGCLMFPTPDLLSQLGGMVHLYFREHRLCEDFMRDLELARQAPRDDTLSFAGPFLVRREDGYSVASLPYYDTIIGAPTPTEFNWGKALKQARGGVRQALRKQKDEGRDPRTGHGGLMVSLYDRPATETCVEKLEQDIIVLSKAVNDPAPQVSRFASRILKRRQDALVAQER